MSFIYPLILLDSCRISNKSVERQDRNILFSPVSPLKNNRKKLVPSPLRRKQFKRFFDCAAKLMESQLLKACKRSLWDFVNYIVDGKVSMYMRISTRDRSSQNHSQKAFSFHRLSHRAVIGTLRGTISINFCFKEVVQALLVAAFAMSSVTRVTQIFLTIN